MSSSEYNNTWKAWCLSWLSVTFSLLHKKCHFIFFFCKKSSNVYVETGNTKKKKKWQAIVFPWRHTQRKGYNPEVRGGLVNLLSHSNRIKKQMALWMMMIVLIVLEVHKYCTFFYKKHFLFGMLCVRVCKLSEEFS